MAIKKDSTVKIVERYIEELEKHRIHIPEAIIFGSHARGIAKPGSEIDVALISDFFSGGWFEDRRKIVPLRRKIDSRMEPMPVRPKD